MLSAGRPEMMGVTDRVPSCTQPSRIAVRLSGPGNSSNARKSPNQVQAD